MRTMVRNGMLMDSATGTEIIVQTERTLGNGKRTLREVGNVRPDGGLLAIARTRALT